ncbi:MoaD/ThiS family protein [Chitiniphilus purpureus]|uniref:MoaD/ThiS family protein n=1 Tax=Chitiniphilus purpureus TaxID=2981137 RepID=A0ABY6DP97_9NEIS|nr:MoaD/ThiS family protein [Chitiniphilus sp. CD1]UXY15857.1 MoaD/ThiS family protein [Chitiniphilus sp. CD1]
MKIRILYLAGLRDALGCAEEALTLPGAEATVAGLLAALRARGGEWASTLGPDRVFRVAVEHTLACPGTPLTDGVEVALFPPVTGG